MLARVFGKSGVNDAVSVTASETTAATMKSNEGAAGLDGAPPFDVVLTGKTDTPQFPWVPESFLDFLESELNDENFYFFHEVNALKHIKNDPNVPSLPDEKFLLLENGLHSQSRYLECVDQLLATFVKENGEKQVNISHDQREKVLQNVQTSIKAENDVNPVVFNEAQSEVYKLMKQDSYPRFVRRHLTTNINTPEATLRLHKSFVFLFLAALYAGLIIGFQVNRWAMLGVFIFVESAADLFISYKSRICVIHALKEMQDMEKQGVTKVVQCPIVKRMTKNRAKKLFALVIVISLIVTWALFGLTYAFY